MESNSMYGSQRGKKGLKVVLIIIAVVAGLLIFMIVGFVTISTGKIENYRDENGNVIENSIAEKITVEINGADNGLIIRGKDLDNPILLLVSSGPGTSDYFYNEAYPNMNLEDYYTVCYWDYRGMCLVYDPDMDPQTITTEQILADAKGVTDYLKERFGKEKIYIMGFSGGYDTIVGERGVTLSGGQKQRVAIARMLMQRAPIMIFDDSLSAVDAETDAKIRDALDQNLGGSTVILISHRITTLMKADCILVLSNGQIAQMGTHQELISQPGIYRDIYNIQTAQEDQALLAQEV